MKQVTYLDTAYTFEFELIDYVEIGNWCDDYKSTGKYSGSIPFTTSSGILKGMLYFELEEDAIMCRMSN